VAEELFVVEMFVEEGLIVEGLFVFVEGLFVEGSINVCGAIGVSRYVNFP
jgi:hypothetical protein